MITDHLRFTVFEANTNRVLSRDLVVKEPHVVKNLSAPSSIEFKIPLSESVGSSAGIRWKSWGQWVLAELEVNGVRHTFCYGLVNDFHIDPMSGEMSIRCAGPLGYPKGIPFLKDFNPIAVDPFEVVQTIWAHLQSFSNANLGIEVTPPLSGTQMLPGYSFDGSTLNFDFFAVFYRAIDLTDCGDMINGLARDIPFDMVEQATWNADRTVLSKQIQLGYPFGGSRQEFLTFRLGENVVAAEMLEELDIEPVSDVLIRGWLPGKVISSELTNEDPTRVRRVIVEENAMIESTERAAAWAKRKLTRRNIPLSFKKITIDPNHWHGPYGSFDVGDSIWVSAPNYPWVGPIEGWHRITSITYQEASNSGGQGGSQGGGTPPGLMELGLRVEGAWNYDPITYDPTYDSKPVKDPNRMFNGYFGKNLLSWKPIKGQWIRVADQSYATDYSPNAGSVRIDCDDVGEAFLSSPVPVTPGEHLTVECAVKWQGVTSTPGAPGFILRGFTTMNADPAPGGTIDFGSVINPVGSGGWHLLKTDEWIVPDGINEVALQLTVDPSVTAGTAWWTFVRVYPTGYVVTP